MYQKQCLYFFFSEGNYFRWDLGDLHKISIKSHENHEDRGQKKKGKKPQKAAIHKAS